jgi:regulator of nucleoside diphosphate kinase
LSIKPGKRTRGLVVDAVGSPRSDRLLLTAPDAARLRAALTRAVLQPRPADDDRAAKALALLAAALRSAIVVPPDRIPADVVTMRSRLVLKDLESGERRELVLVYPEEEAPDDGRVSALSPLGVALLGLSEGALVASPRAGARGAILRVESVGYQPEAAEEFHL